MSSLFDKLFNSYKKENENELQPQDSLLDPSLSSTTLSPQTTLDEHLPGEGNDPPKTPPPLSQVGHGDDSGQDLPEFLRTLLDQKERELQQAGTLGQRILSQQMELEERVRELRELNSDTGAEIADAGVQERTRKLSNLLERWDSENKVLAETFVAKPTLGSKDAATPPESSEPSESITNDLARSFPKRDADMSSLQAKNIPATSRRAKNAAHRANDVEFAFEIGSGLLTEVRRLQTMLGERDETIEDLKGEIRNSNTTMEALRETVLSLEQSTDKYKEENWSLEITIQDLRTQLSDQQATSQKLESEQKRLIKALDTTRESVALREETDAAVAILRDVFNVSTADLPSNPSLGRVADFAAKAHRELVARQEEDSRHATSLQKHNIALEGALDALKKAQEELVAKYEAEVSLAKKDVAALQREKATLRRSLGVIRMEMEKLDSQLEESDLKRIE